MVVVYVTDEDDCSVADAELFDPGRDDLGPLHLRCALHGELLHPVSRYRDAFVALHGRRVVVAAIAGVPVDGRWDPGDPIEELRALQQVDPEDPHHLVPSCDTSMGTALPPVRIAELVYAFGDDGVLASICHGDWTAALQRISGAIQRRMGAGCLDLPSGVSPEADCRLTELDDDGVGREVPPSSADPRGWSVGLGVESCPGGQLRLAGEPVSQDGFVFECEVAP